jgi:hypothetical protein
MGTNIPLNHTLLFDWEYWQDTWFMCTDADTNIQGCFIIALPALLESKENIYFINVTFQEPLYWRTRVDLKRKTESCVAKGIKV